MKDLIIIGAWSAGLPAWMYASRYKISNTIIGALPGGALSTSHKVENYPWTTSASGKEIMDNFMEHAKVSGSEIMQDIVKEVEKTENGFTVKTSSGKELESKFLLLATGNKYRKLGVKWEAEFLGRGVSYCATCDWMFFRNREVAIVWGWDAALTESLYLSEVCSKVHILIRKDKARAETIWIEQANKRENIEFHYHTEVEEIEWDMMWVTNLKLNNWEDLKVDWIFVAVGSDADTWLINHLNPEKDSEGCLVVDKRQETSVKGLYAAWDVTTNSNKFKQTIMSAAEWCLAANSIHEDIIRS